MAIEVAGKRFVTLADEFFVNGAKVYKAFANGVLVYPDGDLPVRIAVTKPPDKTEYVAGEMIDYTGIEVTAYFEDGTPWGVVPFEELVFPVTVYPGETGSADKWSPILEGILEAPIPVGYNEAGYEQKFVDKIIGIGVTNYYEYDFWFGSFTATNLHVPSPYLLIAHDEPFTVTRHWINGKVDPWEIYNDVTDSFDVTGEGYTSYTHNGKKVYFFTTNSPYFGDELNRIVPESCVTLSPGVVNPWDYYYASKIAWAMVYGDFEIPVKWTRQDGVTLETTFTL